ncbi:NADH dehydrogenase subunit K [Bordetella pertussis]|nr:NADH dehydrogenase subunit K [Bordetella pertussis]
MVKMTAQSDRAQARVASPSADAQGNRRNLIILLMSIELVLLAVNMNFVAFSSWFGDIAGQVFVFFILTVAAAEAAIGLAILVLLFRNLNTINVDELDRLKG